MEAINVIIDQFRENEYAGLVDIIDDATPVSVQSDAANRSDNST